MGDRILAANIVGFLRQLQKRNDKSTLSLYSSRHEACVAVTPNGHPCNPLD